MNVIMLNSMMMYRPRTRKPLSLKEKIELIEYHKTNKVSVRKLSKHFKIGKTQAGAILKQEEHLLELWLTNSDSECTRLTPDSIGYQIDKHVYEWYKSMLDGNVQITGPMLQNRSREIAAEMGNSNFKASNGWLGKFLKRHKIFLKPTTLDDSSSKEGSERLNKWREHLASIISNYSPEDVLTADELGLFYNAFPERTKSWKHETCSDGKKLSQRRLTILLCTSMTGIKEDPLIIFKDSKLKNVKPSDFAKYHVMLKSDSNVWMNRDIMTEWLKEMDENMQHQNRNIILFIDNAPSHCNHQLKNIKIEIFPPNISFYEQPMPNGIIQSFKNNYRQQLLQYLLSKQNDINEPTEESIDIPRAVCWVSEAWKNINKSFIQNCFTGFCTLNSKIALNVSTLSFEDISTLLHSYGSTIRPTDYINIDLNLETEGSDPSIVEVLLDADELNYAYSDTEEIDGCVNKNRLTDVHPAADENFQTNTMIVREQNYNTFAMSIKTQNLINDVIDENFKLAINIDLEHNEVPVIKDNFKLNANSQNNKQLLADKNYTREKNSDANGTKMKNFLNTNIKTVSITSGNNSSRIQSYAQALYHLKDLEEFYRTIKDGNCLSATHELISHNQKLVNSNNFYSFESGY